ncbi:hypothetical protein HYU45_03300 [Candidatus Daviesbacteria bacterium]|nr:hypothetical protein [Candidatus Daviesbacteria bacterium]
MNKPPEGEPKTYSLGAFRVSDTSILKQAAAELGLTIEIGNNSKIPVRSISVVNGVDLVDVPQGSVFVGIEIAPKKCPITSKPCCRPTYPFLNKVLELSTATR